MILNLRKMGVHICVADIIFLAFRLPLQGHSTSDMSSAGGAGSGNGAGAAGKDPNGSERRKSKRPKKETDEYEWKREIEKVYYPDNPEFPPVRDHEANRGASWVKPPILVFFNAKGGTLKTTHTWTIACNLSSGLRGLKVCVLVLGSANTCRCSSSAVGMKCFSEAWRWLLGKAPADILTSMY